MDGQDRCDQSSARDVAGRAWGGARGRAITLGVVSALVGLTVGGCVYSHEKERVITAPAPAPAPVVVAAPSERVVMYTEGRWQLYGDGTSGSPYYWAWIPTGASPTAIPPVPRIPR